MFYFILPLQDLVKSHLMNAVRSEVEELKEKIIKLEETINQQQVELTTSSSNFTRELGKLQAENQFLRNHVGSDVINQLSNLEFYDPVNQATQQQQQNQVQNIQDSQSIQVSAFSLFAVTKIYYKILNRYPKVASSRPVYYSILDSFGQRSQYISIKFRLHKQCEILGCATN